MVNATSAEYNLSTSSSYQGLFEQVNGFVGGGMGLAFILLAWLITFFSLQQYPNMDAGKSATWVAWLTSVFMTLIGPLEPNFALLLFLLVLTFVGYTVKSNR